MTERMRPNSCQIREHTTRSDMFEGRPEAAARFSDLVATHYGRVVRYATNLCGEPATGEDLTQITFLKIASALSRDMKIPTAPEDIDATENLEVAYINTVVKNAWGDEIRRRKGSRDQNRSVVSVGDFFDTALGSSSFENDVVNRQVVGAACEQLPPGQRTIVRLFYSEDLPQDEIAVRLHISPATVRTTLFKARSNLRKHLGPEIDPTIF